MRNALAAVEKTDRLNLQLDAARAEEQKAIIALLDEIPSANALGQTIGRSGQHVLNVMRRAGIEPTAKAGRPPESTCRHCGRPIKKSSDGAWFDPEASGDDAVWRLTCDSHDTFEADHEPIEAEGEGVR